MNPYPLTIRSTITCAVLLNIIPNSILAEQQSVSSWIGTTGGAWGAIENWTQGIPGKSKSAEIAATHEIRVRVRNQASVQGIRKSGVGTAFITGETINLGDGFNGSFESILVISGNLTIDNDLVNTSNKRITLGENGTSLTLNGNLDTGGQTTQVGNLGSGKLTLYGNRSGTNALYIRDGEVVTHGILSNTNGGNTQVLENGVVVSSRTDGPSIEPGSAGLDLLKTGTFRFSEPNQINGFVKFSGGTLDLGGFSNSKYIIGNITLSEDSVIDFSNVKPEYLFIADVSKNTNWTKGAKLRIIGFSKGDKLRFGINSKALSADQLSAINFDGLPAQINDQGYVTPMRN